MTAWRTSIPSPACVFPAARVASASWHSLRPNFNASPIRRSRRGRTTAGPGLTAPWSSSLDVGLRPGELFALQRANVAGDLCLIERALESKSGTIGPTKNGRSRTVTVPPVARDAIADLPRNPSGLLFESPRGQMWRQPSHHHRWKVVRAMAGRPGLDFYELRHWPRRCCSNEG
jgi:integrase